MPVPTGPSVSLARRSTKRVNPTNDRKHGAAGHTSVGACPSVFQGIPPKDLGCLPAAFESSVPFQAHDGGQLRFGLRKRGRSSVGMQIIRRRRTEPRLGDRSSARWNKPNKQTTVGDHRDGRRSRSLAPVVQWISTRWYPNFATEKSKLPRLILYVP